MFERPTAVREWSPAVDLDFVAELARPELDVDLLLATDPFARAHAEAATADLSDPSEVARLEASWVEWAQSVGDRPERVWSEADLPLCDREPDSLTDGEAFRRLMQVEASIAAAQALRARLVGLIAAQRPACDDRRPPARPGAAGSGDSLDSVDSDPDSGLEVEQVPEVLEVSEWLSHELQMAHPYSRGAALDLVETSLVLRGRLSATWELLSCGQIDYPRARVMADLLAECAEEVAHTVEAMVLPKARQLTPGGLATAVRRALIRVDALAVRKRQAAARRAADVRFWATADGMARLVADLPLPVAAACVDAIGSYAMIQQREDDIRPVGQIRTEVLSDLILRPFDTTRPAVTGEVTIHLTLPGAGCISGAGNSGGRGIGSAAGGEAGTRSRGTVVLTGSADGGIVDAEVDGYSITAAQCRELLAQLDTSRVFLALHDPNGGGLQGVVSPAELRRAARRSRRREARARRRDTSPKSTTREVSGRHRANDTESDGDPPPDGDGTEGNGPEGDSSEGDGPPPGGGRPESDGAAESTRPARDSTPGGRRGGGSPGGGLRIDESQGAASGGGGLEGDGPGLRLRAPGANGRYSPGRALDRYIRTRDRTCRHFGCMRKAVHCDVDHHIPWPAGSTEVCNLCCYCRTHHRLKHQARGWTREFHSDGTLTIYTPTGITRTTRPPTVDAEAQRHQGHQEQVSADRRVAGREDLPATDVSSRLGSFATDRDQHRHRSTAIGDDSPPF